MNKDDQDEPSRTEKRFDPLRSDPRLAELVRKVVAKAIRAFFALWKDADPDIPILIVTQNGRFLAGYRERFPQQSLRATAVQIL